MTITADLRAYLQAGAFTRQQATIIESIITYFGGLTDTAYGPAAATYLTLSANATLTQERVFTVGAGLSAVDAGAGLAYTLTNADRGSVAVAAHVLEVDPHTQYLRITEAPGADTQIIFNDGGSFGANAGLTFNKTTGAVGGGNATSAWHISPNTAAKNNVALSWEHDTGTNALYSELYFGHSADVGSFYLGVYGSGLDSGELIGDTLGALTWNGTSVVTSDMLAAYQPLDGDLTAVAALSGTGIVRRTGANTWSTGTTVSAAEGGSGASTLTGWLKGNGTSAFTGHATIPVADVSGAQTTITFGTGVQAALGVNIGSAGAPVLFNGALGTPSSGTVTNLTGTASININGTVGATTRNTMAATTGNFSGNVTCTSNVISVGTGTSGLGGNYRMVDDGGTSRWLTGILGSAGARNWVLFDLAAGAARLTADSSTGLVTAGAGLAVTGAISATNAASGAVASSGTTQTNGVARLASTATSGIIDFGMNGSTPWIQATDRTDLSQRYTLALNPGGGTVTAGGAISATTTVKPGSYTVATVPSASAAGSGAMIHVSNDVGGATNAMSDATNWRRFSDRAVVTT